MRMKIVLLLTCLLIGLRMEAQTNQVVFTELKSAAGNVLMTNATYRCVVGEKLFFENDQGEHGFKAVDLDTNILNRLGMSLAQLTAAQSRINERNAAALQTYEQQQQLLAAAQHQQMLNEQAAMSNQAAMLATQPPAAGNTSGNTSGSGHKSKKNKYQGIFPQ